MTLIDLNLAKQKKNPKIFRKVEKTTTSIRSREVENLGYFFNWSSQSVSNPKYVNFK